jgi:hypothetical protein
VTGATSDGGHQVRNTTKPQTDLNAQLDLPLPKKIIEITPVGH